MNYLSFRKAKKNIYNWISTKQIIRKIVQSSWTLIETASKTQTIEKYDVLLSLLRLISV